jgi:hypothetical protein
MDPNKIIAAITALLTLVPQVGSLVAGLTALKAKMQEIADAGGTVSEADWAALDGEVAGKLAALNA